MFAIYILQAEVAIDLCSRPKRNKDQGFRGLRSRHGCHAILSGSLQGVLVDRDRLPSGYQMPDQCVERLFIVIVDPLSAFEAIHDPVGLAFMVEDIDEYRLRIEHLPDLISDEVIDGLHVELGSKPFLDAIDDGQFRGALFRLLEEALGLVEEAGVLEGDAHGVGDRGEQPDVKISERVLAFEVDEADKAAGLLTDDERDIKGGLLAQGAGDGIAAQLRQLSSAF